MLQEWEALLVPEVLVAWEAPEVLVAWVVLEVLVAWEALEEPVAWEELEEWGVPQVLAALEVWVVLEERLAQVLQEVWEWVDLVPLEQMEQMEQMALTVWQVQMEQRGWMAQRVLQEFGVSALKLRVGKPGAVTGSKDVGVIIERSRD